MAINPNDFETHTDVPSLLDEAPPPPPPPKPQPSAPVEDRFTPPPPSGPKKNFLPWMIGAVVLLVVVGFVSVQIYKKTYGFKARITKALNENRIFTPPGDCVADIYAAEKAADPNSGELAEMAELIKSKIFPEAEASLQRFYKESDDQIQWDNLEKVYGLLSMMFPNDDEIGAKASYVRAHILRKNKDLNGAKEKYEEALRRKAGWALAYNGLGKLYMEEMTPLFDEQKGESYYIEACKADPSFTWSFKNLGDYYFKKNNFQAALECYQKALANYPNRASIQRSIGQTYVQMKDFEQGLNYLRQSMQNENDSQKNMYTQKQIDRIQRYMTP